MARIGLFYGSTDGTTRDIARRVQQAFGGPDTLAVHAVETATASDLAQYPLLLFATSTWNVGELQEDWADFVDVLDMVDWHEKQVAFIGTGDAAGYPDTFLDGMAILYEKVQPKARRTVGPWPIAGYRFTHSRACVAGHFVGLALDEINQPELTDARIAAWVAQLKREAW
jgi:flavodoxin I